jgi:hypothetical protein
LVGAENPGTVGGQVGEQGCRRRMLPGLGQLQRVVVAAQEGVGMVRAETDGGSLLHALRRGRRARCAPARADLPERRAPDPHRPLGPADDGHRLRVMPARRSLQRTACGVRTGCVGRRRRGERQPRTAGSSARRSGHAATAARSDQRWLRCPRRVPGTFTLTGATRKSLSGPIHAVRIASRYRQSRNTRRNLESPTPALGRAGVARQGSPLLGLPERRELSTSAHQSRYSLPPRSCTFHLARSSEKSS